MVWLSAAALVAGSALASAQTYDANLVGTWSTKSNKTFTGPGFYDPVNEKLFEPSRTGISYSFTDDGYYEEAYYRAIANPTNPSCPQGIMQWQHGTYTKADNGSLILTPYAVDGRELLSDPCNYDNSIFMRYNQSELFERYEYLIDPYHNIPRLNLYQFDGSPMNPMYLAYKPPQMLPTSTLNPTSTSSGATATATSSKMRRGLAPGGREEIMLPLNHKAMKDRNQHKWVMQQNGDKWWYFGWSMVGLGAFLFFSGRF